MGENLQFFFLITVLKYELFVVILVHMLLMVRENDVLQALSSLMIVSSARESILVICNHMFDFGFVSYVVMSKTHLPKPQSLIFTHVTFL